MAVRVSLIGAAVIVLLLLWFQPGTAPPQPRATRQPVGAIELRADQVLSGTEAEQLRLQMDPQAREALRDEMAAKMRRLPIDSYPELPATLAEALREKGCAIPQPEMVDAKPRNIIHGQFFGPGELGWALYCSVKGKTSLLVFRDGVTAPPEVLFTSADRDVAQWADGSSQSWYGSDLSIATQEFIVSHWQYYGTGPLPFPISHEGVNVGILDKASTVSYYHQGSWHNLPGAD